MLKFEFTQFYKDFHDLFEDEVQPSGSVFSNAGFNVYLINAAKVASNKVLKQCVNAKLWLQCISVKNLQEKCIPRTTTIPR